MLRVKKRSVIPLLYCSAIRITLNYFEAAPTLQSASLIPKTLISLKKLSWSIPLQEGLIFKVVHSNFNCYWKRRCLFFGNICSWRRLLPASESFSCFVQPFATTNHWKWSWRLIHQDDYKWRVCETCRCRKRAFATSTGKYNGTANVFLDGIALQAAAIFSIFIWSRHRGARRGFSLPWENLKFGSLEWYEMTRRSRKKRGAWWPSLIYIDIKIRLFLFSFFYELSSI